MNESRATRYQRGKRRAQAAGVVSGGATLLLLALTQAGSRVAEWADGAVAGWPWPLRGPLALVLFVGAVAALCEVAWLPAAWYVSTRVDARYGRRPPLSEMLVVQAQATFVAIAVALVLGAIVQVSILAAGPWWWLVAGALMAAAMVAALHQTPGLLARLSGARPVDRPALVERLGALARQVRVPIFSIDELPEAASVTATALVAGTGSGRRVFIAADLMRDWSDEEIAVVVAHEMAHHAHHDLWQTLALDVAVLCSGLWAADGVLRALGHTPSAASPIGLAALPAIALVTSAVWLVTAPIRHAVSRRQERQADAFALALTGGVVPFQAAIRRLAERHLAEERPSRLTRWLYHRHPSVAERLRAAESFQRGG